MDIKGINISTLFSSLPYEKLVRTQSFFLCVSYTIKNLEYVFDILSSILLFELEKKVQFKTFNITNNEEETP